MQSAWKPISRNNCQELQSQQWQSTIAGNQTEAPGKMTLSALQRTFLKDESLSKLTDDLLSRRGNIAASIKDDLNGKIYKLNKCSSEEIKLLTSRLLEFLRDIKINVENSKCYDDIIPHWRTNWDTNIDEWSCDVRSLLSTLREDVILELRKAESAFTDTRKFTPTMVDCFLNDQVTKLNHLLIVNEKMYTDTERHLKLLFDTLLQGWLISYSHQEIVINECEEPVETQVLTVQEMDTHRETFKVMDQILDGLDQEEPEFSSVTALKLHLNYLRMCQQHVKLHLKEALLYLRNHLEEQKEYITEEPDRSRMEELWMEIVTILKEQNDEFKNYGKQSAFAWNQFLKRLHCAENSAVRAIGKLRTSKLAKTLAAEQLINSLLDQLRESSSVIHMEQIYDRILIQLENAELTYVSARDEEDLIIKQFINAIFAASDIFSLQLSILNESYPNSVPDVFCVEQNLDETKEITDLEFIRMKYCVFSAQTWIQGLKETLTLLEAEVPKFLKTFVVNLMNVYKGESEYWLMLQLEKITKRKQRIRKNVLEIRASELKAHDTALKHLYQVIDHEEEKAKVELKKIKAELSASDMAVISYLDQTKTNKLADTAEKKMKHLADESLLAKHELVRQHTIRKRKYETERVFKWLSDYCSTYLHSLRLFHEGGNYSYEECESAYKKIVKTTKTMASHKEKFVRRLDHLLLATRDAFNKKLAKIVYPDPTEDELLKAAEREAKDRLEISFNRLKEMIKNETYKATLNLKSLKERIDEAIRGNDFRNWHEAISDIELSCPYFGLSSLFPNLELFTVLQKARKLALNGSSSLISPDCSIDTSFSRRFSLESFKPGKRKKSGLKKRRRTLSSATNASGIRLSEDLFQFSANFEDHENYLTNTKSLINETHSKVRPILDIRLGKFHDELYAILAITGRPFLRFPRMTHESKYHTKLMFRFSKSLKEAFSKYHVSKEHYEPQRLAAIFNLKHYNLQCESVWTFFFEAYLNLFDSVYTNTMSYIELIKKRYMYDSYNSAMKLKATHQANLKKLNVEGVKESIDNKLKPWHGYPLNKALLQQLLKEVVAHCKAQLTSRKEVNETYRDELKTLVTLNKLRAIDVSEDAKFLYTELFTNPVLNSFIDAIWSYCAKSTNLEETDVEMTQLRKTISSFCSRFRKVSKVDPSKPDKYDYILFPFLDGYKFWNFVQNTKQILKTMQNIQEKKGRIPSQSHEYRRKSSKIQYESQVMEGETIEEEEEMFIPNWRQFKDEIDTHVLEFEGNAINSLMVAKKDFDRVSWDLTRWKNEWISNIKEVNRLYLINPILDRPPHKVASDPAAALKPKPDEDEIS